MNTAAMLVLVLALSVLAAFSITYLGQLLAAERAERERLQHALFASALARWSLKEFGDENAVIYTPNLQEAPEAAV